MFAKNCFLILCASCVFVNVVTSYYFEEDKHEPTYLTVLVGHYVLLNCEVEFPQLVEIPYMVNWKRGNGTVFSWYNGLTSSMGPYVGRIQFLNEKLEGYGRASINLTNIREDDAGWYECQIIFPNRTPNYVNNGTWFYLTVNAGNVVAIPPVNQTTLEEEEAQFTCAAKEEHTIITWYKDGVPLAHLSELLSRSTVTKQGTLIIYPTVMGDSGEYGCEAMNSRGEVQGVRAFLNIEYKAKVVGTPEEVFLPFGKPAVLDCHFRSNPPLSNLRWEKDGFLFDPYNVRGVFYRRNGSLYFSEVDDSHNGYYTCTPYNKLGTEGPSPPIHVIVQRPPQFLIKPHGLYLRKLGETLEMPCDATDGQNGHKPIVVWYKKDGSSLPVGRYSIHNGNLTIINVQEEDRGIYLCAATNKAAAITAEAELVVEKLPPNAPHNLTAVTTFNSAHLTWTPGTNTSPVVYTIWYRPKNRPEWRTVKVQNKHSFEATIHNLTAGREYEFMVASQKPNSDGVFSKSISAWTKGLFGETDRYTGAAFPDIGFPRNVTVHAKDEGYLVSWQPPEYGRENLKSYVVKSWMHGSDDFSATLAETNDTSYFVSELEPGNDYLFQVYARSVSDQEAGSESIMLNYPNNQNTRIISTAIVSAFALVAVAFGAFYFIRKTWFSHTAKDVNSPKK